MDKFKLEEIYDDYMIEILGIIELLPKIAKFNFGEKLKESMYEIKKDLIKLYVTPNKLDIINNIDANVNANRMFLRYLVDFKMLKKDKSLLAINKLNTFAFFIGKYMNSLQGGKISR